MPCCDAIVPSDSQLEVTATHSDGCTTGCTSGTKNAILKPGEAGTRAAGSDGFAAALLMIAGLPLSDADKAEAVRRLLREAGR